MEAALTKAVDILQDQLREKDQLIRDLQAQLAVRDTRVVQLHDALLAGGSASTAGTVGAPAPSAVETTNVHQCAAAQLTAGTTAAAAATTTTTAAQQGATKNQKKNKKKQKRQKLAGGESSLATTKVAAPAPAVPLRDQPEPTPAGEKGANKKNSPAPSGESNNKRKRQGLAPSQPTQHQTFSPTKDLSLSLSLSLNRISSNG